MSMYSSNKQTDPLGHVSEHGYIGHAAGDEFEEQRHLTFQQDKSLALSCGTSILS